MVYLGKSISGNPCQNTDSHPCTRPRLFIEPIYLSSYLSTSYQIICRHLTRLLVGNFPAYSPNFLCNYGVPNCIFKHYHMDRRPQKYQQSYQQCSRPCPSGAHRPQNHQSIGLGGARRRRSYQSVAIYCVPAPARVGLAALKIAKYCYISCSRPCPGGARRVRSYRSIAIYRVPAPTQVGLAALKVTEVLLVIVFPPLRR